MAAKKTSAEEAREQAEEAALGSMLDGAFGAMDGIETTTPDSGPTGPPTGPPSGPPTGPPSGPPGGPPTGPPSGPPTGPPSGPPASEESPEEVESVEEPEQDTQQPELVAEDNEASSEEPTEEPETPSEELPEAEEEAPDPAKEETSDENENTEAEKTPEPEQDEPGAEDSDATVANESPEEVPEATPEAESAEEISAEEAPEDVDREMEIARLTAEIERLRGSLVGAAEVIEEIEETPMPPVVLDDIVVPPHIVADFARMGRQLSREALVKGTMGAISILHPDEPGMMVSTRHSTMLSRLDERGIVGGRLGGKPPRGSISDWKVHEVLLASVALVTGGPAACIHMQGPYTTAASCEKDLILVQPIDVLGKEHIGKVVIVDLDDDEQEEFLRQVAEALQQGGMRCVVVRGHGAYAVGANLDQAMANAAMLEHSMQILLLARQANLKI